jgi:hypothetical protein
MSTMFILIKSGILSLDFWAMLNFTTRMEQKDTSRARPKSHLKKLQTHLSSPLF